MEALQQTQYMCQYCNEPILASETTVYVCNLPCGHTLHPFCYGTAFRTFSACPICAVDSKKQDVIATELLNVPLQEKNAKMIRTTMSLPPAPDNVVGNAGDYMKQLQGKAPPVRGETFWSRGVPDYAKKPSVNAIMSSPRTIDDKVSTLASYGFNGADMVQNGWTLDALFKIEMTPEHLISLNITFDQLMQMGLSEDHFNANGITPEHLVNMIRPRPVNDKYISLMDVTDLVRHPKFLQKVVLMCIPTGEEKIPMFREQHLIGMGLTWDDILSGGFLNLPYIRHHLPHLHETPKGKKRQEVRNALPQIVPAQEYYTPFPSHQPSQSPFYREERASSSSSKGFVV